MSNFFQKIKRKFNQLRGLLPSQLPTGATEFEAWVTSIMETYDLPTRSRSDVMFIIATSMMHLGPTVDRKAKYFFVKTLRAGAAKQVAAAAFQEVKKAQLAAAQAAQTSAEATAKPLAVVSNVEPLRNS